MNRSIHMGKTVSDVTNGVWSIWFFFSYDVFWFRGFFFCVSHYSIIYFVPMCSLVIYIYIIILKCHIVTRWIKDQYLSATYYKDEQSHPAVKCSTGGGPEVAALWKERTNCEPSCRWSSQYTQYMTNLFSLDGFQNHSTTEWRVTVNQSQIIMVKVKEVSKPFSRWARPDKEPTPTLVEHE